MATANYIDARFIKAKNVVIVWERDEKGDRVLKQYPAPYYFYAENDDGKYESIYGNKLAKYGFNTHPEFKRATDEMTARGHQMYESDIGPAEKVLMENYYGKNAPKIHYTLLDIEVDYDRDIGHARPLDPYAPINAITMWHEWKDQYVTYAIIPHSWKKAKERIDGFKDDFKTGHMTENDLILEAALIGTDLKIEKPEIVLSDDFMDWIDEDLKSKGIFKLFNTEKELLIELIEEIQDSDLVSGWNSDFFDMPYLTKRTERILGKYDESRWCFEHGSAPWYKTVERYGKEELTVRLSGRQHLDYLALFKKFNFDSRESFSLGNVAEEELKDLPKLQYEGDLQGLYQKDFNFFMRYNIRDVEVLEGLDRKFKYIDLANELIHVNTVQYNAIMGSVQLIDTGIINFCHHNENKIVRNKIHKTGEKIEGAMVLVPKRGLHEWVGSVDIASLYPSTYRALNISPEKILGQFSLRRKAWELIVAKDDSQELEFITEDGNVIAKYGWEWSEIFRKNKWSISAYGTVFDQSNGKGIIPGVLENWYGMRVDLKGTMKGHAKKAFDADGNIIDEEEAELVNFYDRKQHTYKILLNSSYGATVNEWCGFYDPRMGASTTTTGKQITQFMIQKAAHHLTGEFPAVNERIETNKDGRKEYIYTCDNESIIYGDTDSVYFTCIGAKNKEEAIKLADETSERVNDAFPKFMEAYFFSNEGYNHLIECEREVVGDRGIFQTKKKYVIHVVDKEGKPADELKAMGSDIKKSDTPKYIQTFLSDVVNKLLAGANYEDMENFINEFRKEFNEITDPIKIGIVKSCNVLEDYYHKYKEEEYKRGEKVNLPGNVRPVINHNMQIEIRDDKITEPIMAGGKVRLFYLKPNEYNYKSIAISADVDSFPHWFEDNFEIDMKLMEEKLISDKIKLIFDAIDWEVPTHQNALFNSLFEF